MAGFRMHITTSSVFGVGYAGAGIFFGMPIDSCLVAGGLCGVSGMLPDIDSDSGVPIRESMAFAAAVVPMLLLQRFQQLQLTHEQMVLAGGSIYFLVRFGASALLKRFTVHRGMFHSIPAALIFAGLGFLIFGNQELYLRLFKSGGVLVGVMSHLLLDEIYSIEWAGARLRLKKSFGTAVKFWGSSMWANISTYTKLIIVVAMILSEQVVMDKLGKPVHQDLLKQANEVIDTTWR